MSMRLVVGMGSWGWDQMLGFGQLAVAAVLGGLAVRHAKEATRWAERSADLQEWANRLTEAIMPVRFLARLDHVVHDEDPRFGLIWDSWLEIEGGGGSASVFIHRVKTSGASFGNVSDSGIDFGELMGGDQVDLVEGDLPKRLSAGETMIFHNPWNRYTPTPSTNAWAKIRVYYSVATESQRHSLELEVEIPAAEAQNNR